MKNVTQLFFLLFLFSYNSLYSIDLQAFTASDTSKLKRNNLSVLPIAYYTPETRWAFGVTGIYAFRFKSESDESRPSQITLGTAYTLNKQFLLYIPFQLFWDDANWNTYGELGYYRYNYFYYGIGNELDDPDFVGELFDVQFPRLRLNALRKILPNTYLGGRYWFDDYRITGVADDGLLDGQSFQNTGKSVISGAGFTINYDSRENIFYPKYGSYIEATSLFVNDKIGADYNYQKYTFDFRRFDEIAQRHILAVNAYFEFTNGDVPFYQMALLGGGKRMRGYYEGRFRDKHMAILQAEYRFPIYWRFSGALFGAYGGVNEQVKDLFSFDDYRYTYGAGIRFNLVPEERINIRFDVGFAKGISGFYLTIGEAF